MWFQTRLFLSPRRGGVDGSGYKIKPSSSTTPGNYPRGNSFLQMQKPYPAKMV